MPRENCSEKSVDNMEPRSVAIHEAEIELLMHSAIRTKSTPMAHQKQINFSILYRSAALWGK